VILNIDEGTLAGEGVLQKEVRSVQQIKSLMKCVPK
jgi:hypothetical protein